MAGCCLYISSEVPCCLSIACDNGDYEDDENKIHVSNAQFNINLDNTIMFTIPIYDYIRLNHAI